jgi:hypothetical protein
MKTLPNEILALVLKDVCEIDDEVFLSNRLLEEPPQSSTVRMASLFVCRSWYPVACSPFYRTVILRSQAQASRLAYTLGRQPNLGNYVHRIRLTDGFGVTARRILLATPHLTHLSLSLAMSHKSNAQGCDSLPCIQPQSLRLYDYNNRYNNIAIRTLLGTICTCMREKWTRLVEFRFPYDIDRYWKEKEPIKRQLLEAMYRAPFLEIVHMQSPYNRDLLGPLLAKPTLRAIYSETPFGLIQGVHFEGTTDELPIQRLELCCKIYFPLPGPWAPSRRPYESMQAKSQ